MLVEPGGVNEHQALRWCQRIYMELSTFMGYFMSHYTVKSEDVKWPKEISSPQSAITTLKAVPLAEHNCCILIRAAISTKFLRGGIVPSFQKVAVWPFDVIVHEDVPHHALELIDREESTGTIEEVSSLLNRWTSQARRNLTTHACHDRNEGVGGWS